MQKTTVTRGYGFLERFLAIQRLKMANSLIPSDLRTGSILDIGCGLYPLFLMNIDFSKKYGIDKIDRGNYDLHENNIILKNYDVESDNKIPFESEYFDVVTMLAVFEHIQPERLGCVLNEVYRILKPGGIYIMTTPAAWTKRLLKVMATFRLISSVELEEHKDAYSHAKIAPLLEQANFSKKQLRFGYFEMFMNLWVAATK